MRVGTHQCVRIGIGIAVVAVAGPDAAGKVLQVDLVTDPGARRHHAEIVEGLLAPTKELIPLAIAFVLNLHVFRERLGIAELVHHYRMVDDQIHRRQRVDAIRIAAGLADGVAHGGQIHHSGHTGEVLHQYPGGAVVDFAIGSAFLRPPHQSFDIVDGDGVAIFMAQQVFQ